MNGTNIMSIKVTKRDGTLQDFDLDKVHKVLEWAVEGITGVSMSEIELRSNIQLYDKIPAYDIHELLIKSASELISEQTPNYQFVAARLISYKLRKEVYGTYEPWSLAELIIENISREVYDGAIMENYTRDEIDELDSYIMNNEELYRRRFMPIISNIKRKYKSIKTKDILLIRLSNLTEVFPIQNILLVSP